MVALAQLLIWSVVLILKDGSWITNTLCYQQGKQNINVSNAWIFQGQAHYTCWSANKMKLSSYSAKTDLWVILSQHSICYMKWFIMDIRHRAILVNETSNPSINIYGYIFYYTSILNLKYYIHRSYCLSFDLLLNWVRWYLIHIMQLMWCLLMAVSYMGNRSSV